MRSAYLTATHKGTTQLNYWSPHILVWRIWYLEAPLTLSVKVHCPKSTGKRWLQTDQKRVRRELREWEQVAGSKSIQKVWRGTRKLHVSQFAAIHCFSCSDDGNCHVVHVVACLTACVLHVSTCTISIVRGKAIHRNVADMHFSGLHFSAVFALFF